MIVIYKLQLITTSVLNFYNSTPPHLTDHALRLIIPKQRNGLLEDILVRQVARKRGAVDGDHLLGADGVEVVDTNVL